MSHISQLFLKPAVKNKIMSLLPECIADCQDQQTAASFIDDLLTSTEKVMINKRIAIALMILKGYRTRDVEEILKVSLPTIYNVKQWLEYKGSGYRKLLENIIEKDKKLQEQHNQLQWEAENTTPLPGINWKRAKHRQWEKVEETEIPF